MLLAVMPFGGLTPVKATTRSAPGYGSGFNSTASKTEKMVVFAPTPSASTASATAAKPGFFKRTRRPKRRSCQSALISSPQLDCGIRIADCGLKKARPSWFFNPQSEFRNPPSLVPQGHHRINFRRAARRQVAGDERDGREQRRDGGERQGVGRADAVE